jgi:hypothetical protein
MNEIQLLNFILNLIKTKLWKRVKYINGLNVE